MRIVALAGAALLVGLLILALWLYAPDKPRQALEAAYFGRRADYVDVAGLRLHFRDEGRRDAPAIVLLHGFGSSLITWDGWAARLKADYRVVRFDLPGFGLTGPDPTGDYSDERAVTVIRALLERLGIAHATICGNSLGGKIAWLFAVEQPAMVDKLVLVSPDGFASPGFAYGKTPDVPFVLRLLPYVLPRAMLKGSLVPAYGDPARLGEDTVTRYRDMMLAPGVRGAILARTGQVMLRNPEPLLRQITAPTLILWGEKDGMIPFSNAADYARDIPNARLVALPELGHVPFEEAPEQSLAPVLQFLAE